MFITRSIAHGGGAEVNFVQADKVFSQYALMGDRWYHAALDRDVCQRVVHQKREDRCIQLVKRVHIVHLWTSLCAVPDTL